MKEKFLWISVAAIALSWVMNYLFYQSKQLEEPIFLKHYLKTEIYDENQLTFYYLANKQDLSQVSHVEIDGVHFFPHHYSPMWSENNIPYYEQEFRHHYLRSITIHFPKNLIPIDIDSEKEWYFEEMVVGFSDNTTIKTDIGKVVFSSNVIENKILDWSSGSSNNQHRSDTSLIALENVIIEDISVPFDEIEKDIEMKVNLKNEKLDALKAKGIGQESPNWLIENMKEEWQNVGGISVVNEIFPFHLKASDYLQITSFANPNRKTVFDFAITIKGTTDNGKAFTSQAHINDRPYLEQEDVNKLIKEVRGGSK